MEGNQIITGYSIPVILLAVFVTVGKQLLSIALSIIPETNQLWNRLPLPV